MRQVLLAALVGLPLGMALAWWAGPVVAGMIYGLEPRDTTTLVVSATVVFMTTCVAALIPALRGARLEPLKALRIE